MTNFINEFLPETAEERAYMASECRHTVEEINKRIQRLTADHDARINNLLAEMRCPEGVYAYRFNEFGTEYLAPEASEIWDGDEDYIRVRVRAATRRI